MEFGKQKTTNNSKLRICSFLFCYISTLHNSYFVSHTIQLRVPSRRLWRWFCGRLCERHGERLGERLCGRLAKSFAEALTSSAHPQGGESTCHLRRAQRRDQRLARTAGGVAEGFMKGFTKGFAPLSHIYIYIYVEREVYIYIYIYICPDSAFARGFRRCSREFRDVFQHLGKLLGV